MPSTFQDFIAKHLPGTAGDGLAALASSALLRAAFGMALHAIRDQVVHLDQPSIDAVKAVNPALAAELQSLYDLLSSVPAPDSLGGLIGVLGS